MKKLYMLLFLCTLAFAGQSQDVHLAHIHASPVFINPALTGLFKGDVRLIGNYRNQWRGATANYQTFSASVDASLINLGKNDYIGGGIRLLADRAGDLNYSTNQGHFSLSMLKSLDRKGSQFLTAGLQVSVTQQSFDITKVNAFDPEPLLQGADNNMMFGDFAAGISWYYVPQKETIMYLGASLFHINTPRISFFRDQLGYRARVYRKIVLHGGLEHSIGKNFKIMPSFLFLDQGPHKEILTGSFMKHRLTTEARGPDMAFYWGLWLRWYAELDGTAGTDAVVASLRLDHKGFAYTFSYDLNVSSLLPASNGNGGPELSVIYIFDLPSKKRKRIVCPDF